MFDAQTVINQLGGAGRLKAMIGAKNFVQSQTDNWVQFQFMSGAKNKANRLRITLRNDLYDIDFFVVRKGEKKTKQEFTGIYNDQLVSIFEDSTSLYLSL